MSEMDSPTEAPPDDIGADIAAALAEVDAPADAASVEPTAGPSRDASGRFAPKTAAPKTAAPETAATEAPPATAAATDSPADPAPASAAPDVPAGWTGAKDVFAAAPPAVQEAIRKREAEVEPMARWASEMWGAVAPHVQMIQAEGGSPALAVGNLLQMAAVMRHGSPEQKAQLLLQTAHQFGVDLGAAMAAPQMAAPQDPVAHRLAMVEQQMAQAREAAETERKASLMKQINDFAKGATHFAAVRPVMARLLDAGQAKDLQDAYDQAVWLDPGTRAAVQAEQAAKQQAELAKAAGKAKAAAVSVTGAPGLGSSVATQPPAATIEEELRRALGA